VTPGLLWSLDSADIDALDEYEGVETGLYVKKRRTVLRSSDSNPVEVMVYLGRNSGPGTLHEEYAYRVAAAIRRELSMMKKISDRTAELIESLSKQEKARED
jgi:hypothetical protein